MQTAFPGKSLRADGSRVIRGVDEDMICAYARYRECGKEDFEQRQFKRRGEQSGDIFRGLPLSRLCVGKAEEYKLQRRCCKLSCFPGVLRFLCFFLFWGEIAVEAELFLFAAVVILG